MMIERFIVLDQKDSDLKKQFDQDGVLVIENAISKDDCDALKRQMRAIVDKVEVNDNQSVFDTITRDQESDTYFLNSGNNISFFLESGALDKNGKLQVPASQALNKVGHALHRLDPVFTDFCARPEFTRLMKLLGMHKPHALQSMYIFKHPQIGGEVVCHQDSSYLWTEPQSVIGLWFAIEDATISNGCMWGIPGEHKEKSPRSRLQRTKADRMVTDLTVFDSAEWGVADSVPLEVPAGSMIALHGQFPHLSGPNTSDQPRDAFALHFVDDACHYPADNWLERAG